MFNIVLKDILPLIQYSAPIIASALGSPIAGTAISLIAKAFDGDSSDVPGLVSKVLGDSNASDKLKELDTLHGDWISSLLGKIRYPSEIEFNLKVKWESTQLSSL
jgi:hypothetical protein